MNQLFILHVEIAPLEKKKRKVWFCTFNQRRIKQGDT